jgi:hypothetical protein
MARIKPKLPEFTGALAKPVSSSVVFPRDEKYWATCFDEKYDDLQRQRLKKMPLLATALGIKFDHLDLSKDRDLMAFYGCIAMHLAMLVCPGFQEKRRGKVLRETVRWALVEIEKGKQTGRYRTDLDGCLDQLKHLEPELARPANRVQLQRRAKALRNLVSQDRASLKRAHRKQLH